MKKQLFLFFLMFLPMLASAQTVSDIQNSGCLNETRGEDSQGVPTIILTKEGSVLSVQLLNYESNCCTEDFNVTSSINVGFYDEPCLVYIGVDPIGDECNCICPFNVSFTVRDFKPNSFYLECWWYKGMVELTDGVPLVLAFNDEALPTGNDYRPFVEEGKVWKVRNHNSISDNLDNVVDYYYFDGDTIINGKTCKQMMCQRYVIPGYSYDYWTPEPSLTKVGAWYEENQKVYFYDEDIQSFVIKYDFSIGDYESLQLIDDYPSFVIGPKQTGGLKGFKGVYRDLMVYGDGGHSSHSTFWLEGVGGIEGPTINAPKIERYCNIPYLLLSCTVGDEVIYLSYVFEDGATPEGARKKRFDFTHTIKIQPKARIRRGEAQSLYGEYNDQQLDIHLDPLDDDYQVSITDESGKVVYEKAVNAGSIVGLNIDISAYAKGCYNVTVENSQESFTGEFGTQTTEITEIRNNKEIKTEIYNLQGQRLRSLQKGLNIVNGQKIYVK